MPQVIPLTAAPQGFGKTMRRDTWWTTPLVVFIVFTSFIVYATWAAFQNAHYKYGPYLSPFYSPVLFVARRLRRLDTPGSGRSRRGGRRSCRFRRRC